MPSPCAVPSCTNNRHNVKMRPLDISFHVFPKIDPFRHAWIQFCNRGENWTPSNHDVICSAHFLENDFQMSQNIFLKGKVFGRKLLPKAIPTIVKGVATPIAKRLKLDEQRRRHLMKTLYNKDISTTDHEDNSIQEEFDQSKKASPNSDAPAGRLQNRPANDHKATAYDKIVYRLHKFPNVCAFCYKTIEDESLFFSVSLYHVKLQCTIEEKFDEITGAPKDNEDRAEVRHLLPDKICNECLDALVHFHQFQKQLECMRKFSTGMAKLFKGSRAILESLYLEEGEHLVKVLKKLNLCQGSDDKITVERLAKEAANYRPVPNSVGHNRDQPKTKVFAQCLNRDTFRTGETVNDYEKPGSAEIEWNEIVMPAPKTRTMNDAIPLVTSRKYKTARKEQRGAKQWVCPYPDICKEWFFDEAALQQHVRVDHKTFKCRTCGAKFAFYDLYKRHIESHAIARALLATHNKNSTAKEFECDCCDKKFRSEEVFLRHQNIHVGERNYVCDTCLAVYLDAKEFKYHKCSVPNADQPDTSDDTLAEHLYAKPTAAEHATETAELSTLTNNSDFSTGNQPLNDIECLSIEIIDAADS